MDCYFLLQDLSDPGIIIPTNERKQFPILMEEHIFIKCAKKYIEGCLPRKTPKIVIESNAMYKTNIILHGQVKVITRNLAWFNI